MVPNTRDVIDNDANVSYEWNGVKLFSLSRIRARLQGETVAQYKARLDRTRAMDREHTARSRSGKRSPETADATTSGHESDEHSVTADADTDAESQHADKAHVFDGDGPASQSSRQQPTLLADESSSERAECQRDSRPDNGAPGSKVSPIFQEVSVNTGDSRAVLTDGRQGLKDWTQVPPPLKGGGILGGQGPVQSTSPVAAAVSVAEAKGAAAGHGGQEQIHVAVNGWVSYQDFDDLRRQHQQQRLRIEELFVELGKLHAAIGWAKANFPEYLHRLGIVEQQLATAQPPRKPWLPPMPPEVHDREAEAHRLRESLDPSLRAMADYEEGRWPYCAWHLVHAQVRNNGTPISLSLEPRDKMALDHVVELAVEAAYGEVGLGGDLFVFWVRRFLSQDTDALDGHSLVDKFLRCVLAGDMPRGLPESLCEKWPSSDVEAERLGYEPRWPEDEMEFQWAQERGAYYEQRRQRVAAAQEEAKRREEAALVAREAREKELREQYAAEKAAHEALKASGGLAT